MSLDSTLISLALDNASVMTNLRQAGVTADHFVDGYEKVWEWALSSKKKHGTVPSLGMAVGRFTDLEFGKARKKDLPMLLQDLKRRKQFRELIDTIDDVSRTLSTPDDIDTALHMLHEQMISASTSNGEDNLIDLFDKKTQKRMLKAIKKRGSGLEQGFPTGLQRLDRITGGLHRGRMTTVIGRSGTGKSWLNLLFVVSTVRTGGKVILYPLEMTLEETAFRLYTIFSQQVFGPSKVLKNLDLDRGVVTRAKCVKLFNLLEDKYAGSLYVADLGTMSTSYTVDRIDADLDVYRPDLFWVDYLTLMKAPGIGRNGGEDHMTVKALSNGIKQMALRHDCVGGCSAQVNRESIKGNAFLPRIEHISFGDSIGHDSDLVVSVNRQGQHLYYAGVKNRHGPEVSKTRCKFFCNEGLIEDDKEQDDDDDD